MFRIMFHTLENVTSLICFSCRLHSVKIGDSLKYLLISGDSMDSGSGHSMTIKKEPDIDEDNELYPGKKCC